MSIGEIITLSLALIGIVSAAVTVAVIVAKMDGDK